VTPTPRARIHELGVALRSSLSAVLAQVGGPNVRPVVLARTLRIDDSLSARLLRSVRSSDPLSALRELPAPQGLWLFLAAAGKAGVDAATEQAAEAAVRNLEELINELPLGRASLDAAIDGWLPSGRAKAERASKQAVFKALSQTLGYTVDTVCYAMAIQPSAAGDCCDSMAFRAMDGIRRMREGSPIQLFGYTRIPAAPGRDGLASMPAVRIETLEGEREVTDAKKLLLPDVGNVADLPMRLVERGHQTRVVLEASEPPLNVPVTSAVAYIMRNSFLRYRTGDDLTEANICACKVPIRVLIQDIFLHEDVYPTFTPNIVPRLIGIHNPSDPDEELLELDKMDLDVDLVKLGWGLDRIGVKEWGGYEPALREAFGRAGWDASRFRAYRCYIRYPFPFITLTTWFDLPERP
jgi:hypothetical protein